MLTLNVPSAASLALSLRIIDRPGLALAAIDDVAGRIASPIVRREYSDRAFDFWHRRWMRDRVRTEPRRRALRALEAVIRAADAA